MPRSRIAAKVLVDRGERSPLLIFDDTNVATQSRSICVEAWTRSLRAYAARCGFRRHRHVPRQAGRPKLGVVGREVTLLPRHWDWLAKQPGGASVALRRLVDAERKASGFKDLAHRAEAATDRFVRAIAGDFPQFEAASRALLATDRQTFVRLTEDWPVDVRDHARWLMAGGAGSRDDATDA